MHTACTRWPAPCQLDARNASSPLQTQSLPALCECLRKAAVDPRIKGVVVKIDPLAAGWGKLQVGGRAWLACWAAMCCSGD